MSLNAEQVTWINRMGGLKLPVPATPGAPKKGAGEEDGLLAEFLAKRDEEMAADAERKDYLLAQAAASVDKQSDVLRAAFDFEIRVGNRLTGSTEKMRDDKKGNQETEVDTVDVNNRARKGDKVRTMKDGKEDITLLSKATNAFSTVVAEQKRLETATTTRSLLKKGAEAIESEIVPLFTTKEIGDGFFTPLVRARLISDNVVTDKYSATQQMIDATNTIYIDEELKNGTDRASNLSQIGGTFASIGGSVANLVTEQFGVDSTMVQGVIEAGVELVSLGITAGAMGLGFEEADVSSLCSKIPAAVGNLVGAATGMPEIGTVVTASGSGAVSIGSFWISRVKGKPVTADDITDLVKSCVLDMMNGLKAVPEPKQVAEVAVLLADAASAIDASKVSGIAAGLKKGDWKAVTGGVLSMLSDFAAAAPQVTADGLAVGGITLGDNASEGLTAAGKIVAKGTLLLSDTITAKDANDVAASMAKNIPGIIGQVVGVASSSPEAAQVAKDAAKAFGQVGILLTKKATNQPISPQDLAAAMTAAVNAVFDDVALAPGGDNPEVAVAQTQLLAAISSFGSSGDATTLLGNGPVADKKKAVAKLLLQMLLAAPGAASAVAGAAPGDAAATAADGLDQAQTLLDTITEQVEGAQERLASAKAEIDAIQKELDDGYAKKAEDESGELIDEFERTRAEYQASVKAALQPGGDQKVIMKMIADMKKQQAVMAIAISVGSAGAEVAAQFFAPLAVGKELLVMTANIAIAIERARDLKKMLDARQWAESAVSVYRTSIDNFVKNQSEQLTEHSIKAAMNALRIAAEVAATAYPKAKVVATAVSIAQSGVNAGFALYKEVDMRHAWSVTKEALADTKNRKLGLKARRLNATLAKYSIAYGAYTEKDPVAVKTMNEIGLTNDMLQSEEAGVKLVKLFLETRFHEDPKVGGKWDTTVDWQKGLAEPRLASVSLFGCFKRIGTAAAPYFATVPAALIAPPNAAVGAMNQYMKFAKQHEDAAKNTDKLRDAGKAKGATEAQMKDFLAALVAETDAGLEARRLLKDFMTATTACTAAITGLAASKDAAGFPKFQSEAMMLVVAYRDLAADELGQLESDLLTPQLERNRMTAALKAAESKLAA